MTTTTTPSLAFLLEGKGGGQGDEKRRSDPSSVAKEGDGRTTSVVVTTPFASVAAGKGDGQWKHQERRQVFPLGTA